MEITGIILAAHQRDLGAKKAPVEQSKQYSHTFMDMNIWSTHLVNDCPAEKYCLCSRHTLQVMKLLCHKIGH